MTQYDGLLGRQLANFRIERLLGVGGMGRVYYGWDIGLERPVAIKIIDASLRGDQSYARRFVQEARAIAAWEHPSILQIYFADHQAGLYFYAMEYIQGCDLDKIIQDARRRGERLPARDVLHIARSVASALDYAHSHGVIHRDVKPANILIAEDGRVVLTDFGLAMDVNLGTLGEVFGSPRYIAPEQARNSAEAVPASDLYALGVVLYQLLTGELPFDDPSPATLAVQHLTAEPPLPRSVNPEISEEVERILLKTLRKDPAGRYASGQQLVADLEHALQELDPGATHLVLDARKPSGETPATLTHLSLTERVAENMQAAPEPTLGKGYSKTQMVESPPAGVLRRAIPAKLSPGWIGGGCILGALVCGLLSFAAFSRLAPTFVAGGDPLVVTATRTPGTPVAGNTSGEGNIGGRTPSPTDPVEIAVSSALPPVAPALPTQSGDDGERRFTLLYNQTSLYFVNRSGSDVPATNFAFERLNKDGNPDRRMEGRYWAQIYASFRDGYCLVIRQFGDNKALEPEECVDRQLVVRTPTEEQDVIFWTKKEGAKEFRVLWRDQEVARCPAGEGVCEVILP